VNMLVAISLVMLAAVNHCYVRDNVHVERYSIVMRLQRAKKEVNHRG
jgi:hypothetical protein